MDLKNKTPFAAERVVLQDPTGRDVLVVVLKATYRFSPDGVVSIAEKQAPIALADEHYGEPGASSVRYESDLALRKAGTDVILIGNAYAPAGETVAELDVSLSVGSVQRTVRVFGDRFWRNPLGFASISSPEPFEKIPLVYERAFGGRDCSAEDPEHHEQEARNPVGMGLIVARSGLPLDGIRLPNIEDAHALIRSPTDRPTPAGFGYIGRHWQPRVALAGTYDDAWKLDRAPLLPDDFDERYFNGAHAQLIAPDYFVGGEPVELFNCSVDGPVRFVLPTLRPKISALGWLGAATPMVAHCDTVTIEPDERRFSLVWRATCDVYKKMHDIARIVVEAKL